MDLHLAALQYHSTEIVHTVHDSPSSTAATDDNSSSGPHNNRSKQSSKKSRSKSAIEDVAPPVSSSNSSCSSALWRSRLLLVRSSIAAVGVVVSALPNFCHPFVARFLSATLTLEHLEDSRGGAGTGGAGAGGVSSSISAPSSSSSSFSSAQDCSVESVRADIDRCLSTIATKIPPRLTVPVLLQAAPAVLAGGHRPACRFADLLGEVWQQLDRSTVMAHLVELSTLATLLLDYRRVHGCPMTATLTHTAATSTSTSSSIAFANEVKHGMKHKKGDTASIAMDVEVDNVANSDTMSAAAASAVVRNAVAAASQQAAREVDFAAADAVMELCLKLTETELKTFLARLGEWKDLTLKKSYRKQRQKQLKAQLKLQQQQQQQGASDDASGENGAGAGAGAQLLATGEWRLYSRSVSYYSLIGTLMGKLKGLFVPTMGTLWNNAAGALSAFAASAAAYTPPPTLRVHGAAQGAAPGKGTVKAKAGKRRRRESDASDEDGESDGDDSNHSSDDSGSDRSGTGKKRKRAGSHGSNRSEEEEEEEEEEREDAEDASKRAIDDGDEEGAVLQELRLLSQCVVVAVRDCCTEDSIGMVDEVRALTLHSDLLL